MHLIWIAVRWFLGKRGPAFTHRWVAERRRAAEEMVTNCLTTLDQTDSKEVACIIP
jgi:hypothetical protein